MNSLTLIFAAACVFAITYRYYGLFLANNVLNLRTERDTPAVVSMMATTTCPPTRWFCSAIISLHVGGKNVTGIYAFEPMTHVQTANNYPDMTAIGFIQQFALLNRFTLPVNSTGSTYTAYSYPIHTALIRKVCWAIPYNNGQSA